MRKLVVFLAVMGMAAALAAGFLLAGPFDRHDPVREAQAQRLLLEAQHEAAVNAALLPLKVALYAAGGALGLLAAGLGAWAGFLYLRRRALTVYADRNGVMPLLLLRPEEFVVDGGAIAGPLAMEEGGPAYRLPAAAVPRLQAQANQGAALTRSLRAWATQPSGTTKPAPPALREDPAGRLPPVEILEPGAEPHILQLLEGEVS